MESITIMTPEMPGILDNPSTKLKRELTLTDLVMMGLGNVVGAGAFVILGKSILFGGKYTIPAFLVVAVASVLMGFVYLEIYSRYKSDITEFLAIRDTMGDDVGKIALYVIYLFAVLSAVTIVVSMTKYVSRSQYFAHIFRDDKDNNGSPNFKTRAFEIAFGCGLIALMSAINYAGIHVSKIVANSIAVIMLLVLGGVAIMGSTRACVADLTRLPDMPWNSVVMSGILSLFLFNGYDFIVKVSDESVDPEDNKRALIYTLLITSVIYLCIIVSGVCILKYGTASTTYNLISKIYETVAGKNAGLLAYAAGLVVMFNTAFLSLLSASRFIYSCGKENNIGSPDFWSKLSEYRTPTNAILVSFAIAAAFSLVNNEVSITVFTNFAALFILMLLCIALIATRWAERADATKKLEHNYIIGNIENIPVPVIIALLLILYAKYKIIQRMFAAGG
jgi:APA family basic amino acid/polyamine antiporter